MSSLRQLRVRELLKREIGESIRREISIQQAGVITVNDVLPSADFRQALVMIGFFGTAGQQKSAMNQLESVRHKIQEHVARTVILKFTPKLRFEIDDSIERGNRVMKIIEDIEQQKPAGE